MTSTHEHNIIKILSRLDVPGNAAKIYLFLLKNGPANGYTIGKISGVNSAVVYRELERLKSKNLVYQLGVDPKRYEAINANRLVEILHRQNESEETQLEESLNSFLKDYKTLVSARITEYDDLVSEIQKYIQNANKEVFIRLWSQEYARIENELADVEGKGVDIQLLSFDHLENPGRNHISYNLDPKAFKENWKRGIAISVDHDKAVIGNKIGKNPIEGLITNDPLIVESIRDQIQLDIELAKIRLATRNRR